MSPRDFESRLTCRVRGAAATLSNAPAGPEVGEVGCSELGGVEMLRSSNALAVAVMTTVIKISQRPISERNERSRCNIAILCVGVQSRRLTNAQAAAGRAPSRKTNVR
jgi:hypothetical protein